MAKDKALEGRLENTDAGFSQDDLVSILRHNGYEFVRNARHGAIFRHPELVVHPDEMVRRRFARVMVPVGKELPKYVARAVRDSIHALLEHREGENG